VQIKDPTVHRHHAEQLIPYPQDQGDSVFNRQHSALVHVPWAGWQPEIPGDEGRISRPESVREVDYPAGRADRVMAEFRVKSAGEAAMRVSEAVALAELEAYAEQTRGVLVRRHDFDLFSIALSSMVPFGVTLEEDSAPHQRPRRALNHAEAAASSMDS
jgi:hypothetical protein